ncbi:hypothetical protein MCY_00046 [Bartonella rattimassiliensis 15908]|uniref:Uncharacterized protein n=1 Tax=Bartonella rattimassiliensis 15908 TaxID=1094556 RepID=J0ZI21_9HYPH|nr:hypothetical protein MCY_00046 [Bartonella rattimassiliensis 15908]
MDWKDVSAFYKILCQTTAVIQLALRLLILTGVCSTPLRHIREDQVEDDIWTILSENMRGRRDTTKELRVLLSKDDSFSSSRAFGKPLIS